MLGTRINRLTKRRSNWPGGALAIWNLDEYKSTPRPCVPNSLATNGPSRNIYSASRRLFSRNDWWSVTTLTVTDLTATAPDGQTTATTLVSTGNNWSLKCALSHTLPAGTYTIAAYVKSNGGALDQFCFYDSNTSNRGSTLTATGSWARYSRTFTIASPASVATIGIGSKDGSTGCSLQVSDLELYAGTADLGPEILSGHMMVGATAYDTRPTFSRGELNLSSVGYCLSQFSTAHSFSTSTGITIQGCVAQTATHPSGGYSAILSKAQSFGQLTASTTVGTGIGQLLNGATFGQSTQLPALWNTLNAGYHVFTLRHTGTVLEFWIDDCKVLMNTTSFSATTAFDYFTNITNTVTLSGGNRFAGSIAIWDRSLSDTEVRQAVAMQQDRCAKSSINAASITRFLCAEGDSISAHDNSITYPWQFGPNANPALFGIDLAVSGSTISNLNLRAAQVDAMLPPYNKRAGRKFILSVLIGTNDLASYPGGTAAWLAALATYLDARRAAGWLVAIGTILPCTTTGFNAARNTANTTLRTWTGVHCDAIFDFAADATMGPDSVAPDGGAYNATYYSDGKHPTAAGHIILETIYRATINGM